MINFEDFLKQQTQIENPLICFDLMGKKNALLMKKFFFEFTKKAFELPIGTNNWDVETCRNKKKKHNFMNFWAFFRFKKHFEFNMWQFRDVKYKFD